MRNFARYPIPRALRLMPAFAMLACTFVCAVDCASAQTAATPAPTNPATPATATPTTGASPGSGPSATTSITDAAKPGAAAASAAAPSASPALEQLGWLHGCWEGKVNGRDFREEWLPLDGDLMVGASQTVLRNKTSSFEFLRLEPRSDGVYYVDLSQGKDETALRLSSHVAKGGDEIFTFTNANREVDFPRHIIYRRATEGWLYATVDGKINGTDKQVIFPMRRVDCKTGAIVGE